MKRITVIGGCSLDQTFYNQDGKYSDIPDIAVPGGKAANQAVAAARAGADVSIITRLGNDGIGRQILTSLRENNVNTEHVEMVDGLANDFASIYIDRTGDNDIRRCTGAIDSFTPELIERHKKVLLDADIVIAQMKAPKAFCTALINFCHENGKMLVVTPCRPEKLKISENKELLDRITLITANQRECEAIFETTDIEACVRQYPNKLIVTIGERGVIYFDGTNVCTVPAVKVTNVVDTTGAGDTFNGNLIAALTQGFTLQAAIHRGQLAAAMKIQVQTAQAGMPWKSELDTFINSHA